MRTLYAKSGGVTLAYEIRGDGAPTLIYVPAMSNTAMMDRIPPIMRHHEHLARICRLVRYDRRGTGQSDPVSHPPTVEEHTADVEAIRTAAGADTFALLGIQSGCYIAITYALAHADCVSHLILIGGACCDASDPEGTLEHPPLMPWDDLERALDSDFDAFGETAAARLVPHADAAQSHLIAEYMKSILQPATFHSQIAFTRGFDLRDRLNELAVPTLIIHARGDTLTPVSHSRYMARRIPGATYLELDSAAAFPFLDEANTRANTRMHTAIEEFLTGRVQHTTERRFATVLFTDIVQSTSQQHDLGDTRWGTILEQFEAGSRRIVEQFGGCLVQLTGDGILATFPLPSEALRATQALVADAQDVGLEIRAGLHAGEISEVEAQIHGSCVHEAARVAAKAGASEILTTLVVQGLVEGLGFEFANHGEHDLKGIGSRRLVKLT